MRNRSKFYVQMFHRIRNITAELYFEEVPAETGKDNHSNDPRKTSADVNERDPIYQTTATMPHGREITCHFIALGVHPCRAVCL